MACKLASTVSFMVPHTIAEGAVKQNKSNEFFRIQFFCLRRVRFIFSEAKNRVFQDVIGSCDLRNFPLFVGFICHK